MTIKTDEDGEKYYTPDGENIDPIQIPDSEFADENAEFKEGDSFEAEVDTVMARQFLSDNIYAGFEASIRELYNNEVTASHKARAMGDNAHPIIHVMIDPTSRYFEITGEDSLGISPMVFRRKLSVMGRSGNLADGGEIGQFGLGFASYKKMFNIIHVSTWARGRKEDGTEFKPYTILCEGGVSFTPTKAEKMLHLGTKIHGIYKEGISADKIIETVKECAKHQDVPTWIHLQNDSDEETKGNYKCEQYRDGYHYLMQMRADAIESHSSRRDTPVFFRPIKIIRDDFEFYAYIGMNRSRWGGVEVDSIHSDDCEIRLVNTPIHAELDYDVRSSVSGYFLNIKDERKYQPTADRDRMADDSMTSISEEIKEELKELYDEYRLIDVADYNSRENKYPYNRSMWRMLNSILSDTTTDTIVDTLLRSYSTAPSKRMYSIQDMITKQTDQKRMGITHSIVALKGLRAPMMNKLESVLKGEKKSCVFFRLPTDEYDRSEDRLKVLRQLGIVFGEEYARENKLKAQRIRYGSTQRGEAVDRNDSVLSSGHRSQQSSENSWGWGRTWEYHTSHLVSEVNENAHPFIIKVKTADFDKMKTAIYHTDFMLVHDLKGFNNKIKSKDDVFKELENTEFEVNQEIMTFKELVSKQKKDQRTTNKPKIIYLEYNADYQDDRVEKFTVKELGLNPDECYLITPTEKPSNVSRLIQLLHLYNYMNENINYVGKDDHKVVGLLSDKLLIDDDIEGDKVEKISALLRMYRKCEEADEMEIYNICKEALVHDYDNETNSIMKLVDKALEKRT